MTVLLDTNVVSALRVRGRNPAVEAWVASVPVERQFISVFTVAEIEAGVVKKERVDRAQGEVLRRWFESQVLPAFADRVLPYDLAAARVFASYRVPEHAPADDAVIAAVADANALVVATRNVAHFAPLGVAVVNPFDQAAPSSSVAALETADDEVDRRAAASARAEMCEAEAAPIPWEEVRADPGAD